MKICRKITTFMMVVIVMLCLDGCSQSAHSDKGGSTSSRNPDEEIRKVENLIDGIGEIKPFFIWNDPDSNAVFGEEKVDDYEKAKRAYDALTQEEQARVSNADVLNKEYANYTEVLHLIEKRDHLYSIYPAVEKAVIDKIKGVLKDPGSLEEVEFKATFLGSEYDSTSNKSGFGYDMNTGKFRTNFTLTYSATNSFGGRLQDDISGTVTGKYENGKISDIKVDSPELTLKILGH